MAEPVVEVGFSHDDRCASKHDRHRLSNIPSPNEGDDAIIEPITSAVERLEAASARATRPKGPDI